MNSGPCIYEILLDLRVILVKFQFLSTLKANSVKLPVYSIWLLTLCCDVNIYAHVLLRHSIQRPIIISTSFILPSLYTYTISCALAERTHMELKRTFLYVTCWVHLWPNITSHSFIFPIMTCTPHLASHSQGVRLTPHYGNQFVFYC